MPKSDSYDISMFLTSEAEKQSMTCPEHKVYYRNFVGAFGDYFACPKRLPDNKRCKMRPSKLAQQIIGQRVDDVIKGNP